MESFEAVTILKELEALKAEIKVLNDRGGRMQSDQLNELYDALAKAQPEFKRVEKNIKVDFTTKNNIRVKYNYANLESIVNATRPALSKNGLVVFHPPVINERGKDILHTRLGHSSGQWVESRLEIKPPEDTSSMPKDKDNIQKFGSRLSFLRRYSYSLIVGVVAGDEDDDGRKAMGYDDEDKYVDKSQIEILEKELEEFPDIINGIFKTFKIKTLSQIPKEKFDICIKRIREITRERKAA